MASYVVEDQIDHSYQKMIKCKEFVEIPKEYLWIRYLGVKMKMAKLSGTKIVGQDIDGDGQ